MLEQHVGRRPVDVPVAGLAVALALRRDAVVAHEHAEVLAGLLARAQAHYEPLALVARLRAPDVDLDARRAPPRHEPGAAHDGVVGPIPDRAEAAQDRQVALRADRRARLAAWPRE